MPEVLGPRALGRATLARQSLLTRSTGPVTELLERLYGLQAQSPTAPYFALHARMRVFRPEQLSALLRDRSAVRIATLRGTVHLLTAADAAQQRALTQPVLDRDLDRNAQHALQLIGVDRAALAALGRELVEQTPRSMAELRPLLGRHWPDRDPAALAYGVRGLLPLVQVPPRGLWGRSGQPVLTTLEHWTGRPVPPDPSLETMLLRYLAAYGPASAQDAQTWSGLPRLGEVFDRIRPQLRTFRAESGTELFDLPDAPRPDSRLPVPVRLLAPFDNVLLSYADRSRLLDDVDKPRLFSVNGIVSPAVLVNGRVTGVVSTAATERTATATIEWFRFASATQRAKVEREALRLLKFAYPDRVRQVRFTG